MSAVADTVVTVGILLALLALFIGVYAALVETYRRRRKAG